MAHHPSAIVNWSQYLALRFAESGMHLFDVDLNLATARAVGRWMYRLDRRHRERALSNIRRSMPELSGAEVQQVARQSMEHFVQLAVEVLFTPRLIHADTWADRIVLTDMAEAIELLLSPRPTILVTAHFGNWELMGYLLTTLGIEMSAVARPIDNPLINRHLLGVRERRGLRIITKWGATEQLTAALHQGGTVGFIGDQNAGDKGLFVPFFGRLASAYKSIGLLAMQYDAAVICGYARRMGDRFRYELGVIDVIRPEHWKGQPDPLYYLTARYTRAVEQMVRLAPDQYLWIHRRWKSRPKHERAGQPMPAGLRRQIESLDWVDQDLMRRLEQPGD